MRGHVGVVRVLAALTAASLVACGHAADRCPAGSYLSEDDACAPGSSYEYGNELRGCGVRGHLQHTRLCVEQFGGNWEYDPVDDASAECGADRSCARGGCEDVDYCEPNPLGRLLARTDRLATEAAHERSPLAALAALALLLAGVRAAWRRRRRLSRAPGASRSGSPATPLAIEGRAFETRSGRAERIRAWAWRVATIGVPALALAGVAHRLSPFDDDAAASGVALLVLSASGVVLAPLLLVVTSVIGRRRALGLATLRLEDGALRLDVASTSRSFAVSRIAQGIVIAPGRLRLELHDATTLELATDEVSATRMLEALELDVTRRDYRMLWHQRGLQVVTFVGVMAVGMGFVLTFLVDRLPRDFGSAGPLAAACALGLSIVYADGVARWVSARELRVGLDEIAEVALGRLRALRFADVASLDALGVLLVTLRDQSEARLSVDPPDDALRAAFLERAWRARATAARLSATGVIQIETLRRGGRSLADWRAALRGTMAEKGGFRDAAGFGKRDVLALASDPGADAELRIAAALAIGAAGDEDDRRRVQLAARCTSSAALAAALEEALRDAPDEKTLGAAMVDLGVTS